MHGISINRKNAWGSFAKLQACHDRCAFSYKRLKDTDKSLNFPGIKLEPDFIDIWNLIERREAGTSYAIRFTVNYDARNFQTF